MTRKFNINEDELITLAHKPELYKEYSRDVKLFAEKNNIASTDSQLEDLPTIMCVEYAIACQFEMDTNEDWDDLTKDGKAEHIEKALTLLNFILNFDEEFCNADYEMIRKVYTTKFIDATNIMADYISDFENDENDYWLQYSELVNSSQIDEEDYDNDILDFSLAELGYEAS